MKRREFLGLPFLLIAKEIFAQERQYEIEVWIRNCRLNLYETQGAERRLVREYAVATVKPSFKVFPIGQGEITKIEFNPWWFPTALSIAEFRKKGIWLPQSVPPGDPLNYMGTFKMHLSHRTKRGQVYRIHGNNDHRQIGKRVTGGCIRMHNDQGEALASLVSIGTKVSINL